jgi:hypothetical protein
MYRTPRALTSSSYDPDLTQNAAIHEAGHAIIARVVGVLAGRASIVPTTKYLGIAETADPPECRTAWAARGRFRPERYARDACVIVSAAGAIAERVILGADCGRHGSDVEEIERLLPHDPGDRIRYSLIAATYRLVTRHRFRIELLAELLRVHREIDGPDIDMVFSIGAT